MPFDLLLFFNLVFIFIWYLNLLCLTLLPISYVVGISITTDHWRKNKACFLHYLVPCSVVPNLPSFWWLVSGCPWLTKLHDACISSYDIIIPVGRCRECSTIQKYLLFCRFYFISIRHHHQQPIIYLGHQSSYLSIGVLPWVGRRSKMVDGWLSLIAILKLFNLHSLCSLLHECVYTVAVIYILNLRFLRMKVFLIVIPNKVIFYLIP